MAISFLQAGSVDDSGVTNSTIPMAGSTGTNVCILVFVQTASVPGTVVTSVDWGGTALTEGNNFVILGNPNAEQLSVWYGLFPTGSNADVHVFFNQSNSPSIKCVAYDGVLYVPDGAGIANPGAGPTPVTTTVTTTQTGDWIVLGVRDDNDVEPITGSGYVSRFGSGAFEVLDSSTTVPVGANTVGYQSTVVPGWNGLNAIAISPTIPSTPVTNTQKLMRGFGF